MTIVFDRMLTAAKCWDPSGEQYSLFMRMQDHFENEILSNAGKSFQVTLGFREPGDVGRWFIHSRLHINPSKDLQNVSFIVEPNTSILEDGDGIYKSVMARCMTIVRRMRNEGLNVIGWDDI